MARVGVGVEARVRARVSCKAVRLQLGGARARVGVLVEQPAEP